MIETSNLRRTFGDQVAVRDISLRVEAGELFGFLGSNGAGKTTTIRMLCGLLRPSSGELRIDGHDYVTGADHVRRVTGLIPDTPPLYEYLTGHQYIAFVASLYGISTNDRLERAEELLKLFGLEDRANELCKGYSHGMRKKLHITAVLVTQPKVLFLDEPTTGLDPRSARILKDLLLDYRSRGTTMFLSTHRLDIAEEVCDRVAILRDGELLAMGAMDELRSRSGDESLESVFLRLVDENDTAGTHTDASDVESTSH